MEKVKEIELLQSLKGDTYFAQLFGNQQIDAMCQNIRNDYPIEYGLKLFQVSPVAHENAELKGKIARLQQVNEAVAKRAFQVTTVLGAIGLCIITKSHDYLVEF